MSLHHLPRESVFPIPSTDHLNYLEDCVQATEACAETLHNGLTRLEPGTRDLPRLTKILSNTHHFLVLPAPVIAAHKAALSQSLAPHIESLIVKAESQVEAERGRVDRLEERISILQSARLPLLPPNQSHSSSSAESATLVGRGGGTSVSGGGGTSVSRGGGASSNLDDIDLKDLNPAQRRKIIMLRGKRDKLEKEKARLIAAST